MTPYPNLTAKAVAVIGHQSDCSQSMHPAAIGALALGGRDVSCSCTFEPRILVAAEQGTLRKEHAGFAMGGKCGRCGTLYLDDPGCAPPIDKAKALDMLVRCRREGGNIYAAAHSPEWIWDRVTGDSEVSGRCATPEKAITHLYLTLAEAGLL